MPDIGTTSLPPTVVTNGVAAPIMPDQQSSGQLELPPELAAVQQYREDVEAKGYLTVALFTNNKKTFETGWQNRGTTKLPTTTEEPKETHLNTGILCAGLRVFDIDTEDVEMIAEAVRVIEAELGPTPMVRSRSNSPRRAMFYRAAEGSPGKVSVPYGPGPLDHVEVLGNGQQVHVGGLHPSGVKLQWSKPPTECHRDLLPSVTVEQCGRVLARLGAIQQQRFPAVGNALKPTGTASPPIGPSPPVGPQGMTIPTVGSALPQVSRLTGRQPSRVWQQPGLRLPDMNVDIPRASMDEMAAAIASYPDGFPGCALGPGDIWRNNFMFPLADYAARFPQHEKAIRNLFDAHTRRIADPHQTAAHPGGAVGYFDDARARFDGEIVARRRNPPHLAGKHYVSYMRVIRNALGHRPESTAAGYGDKWDGLTPTTRQIPGMAQTVARLGQAARAAQLAHVAQTNAFFVPVAMGAANLRPVPHLVPGLLIRGDISLLVAQGGGAKTAFSVTVAVSLAAGRMMVGPFKVEQVMGGIKVAIVSAEEDGNRIALMVQAAIQQLGLSPPEVANVARNLMIHDARGSGFKLEPAMNAPGMPTVSGHSPSFAMLRSAMIAFRPDLLILDTAASLMMVDNENDNSAWTDMLVRLGRVAAEVSAAVLLLHHTPKMTRATAAMQRGEPTLSRGGSALVNTARIAWTITAVEGDDADQFMFIGGADRVRRLDPMKANDTALPAHSYFQTVTQQVTTQIGTSLPVRAIDFITPPPPGAPTVPVPVKHLALMVVQRGTTDSQGKPVPFGVSLNKGSKVVEAVAADLVANGASPSSEAEARAKKALMELLRDGCIAVEEVPVPQYKTTGARNGAPGKRRLIAHPGLAAWLTQPSGAGGQPGASPSTPAQTVSGVAPIAPIAGAAGVAP